MSNTPTTQTTANATPQERFKQLAAEWKEQSQWLSNTVQMAMLSPYQKIIGMGKEAIPFILDELRREPDQWFWALEHITDENPVASDAAGQVRLMAQAWIEWGTKNGFMPK